MTDDEIRSELAVLAVRSRRLAEVQIKLESKINRKHMKLAAEVDRIQALCPHNEVTGGMFCNQCEVCGYVDL